MTNAIATATAVKKFFVVRLMIHSLLTLQVLSM